MDPNSSAQKRGGGPFGKRPASKLNQAFDAAAGMSSPPNPLDGATPTAPGTDPFAASRRLLATPDAPGSSVRDALEEAALKLSSVGTILSPGGEAPNRAVNVRAADDGEWDLAADNPVFNDSGDEVTPRAAGGLITPPRSTPRSTSLPGSAQKKQEAESFPKSYPVKKPAPLKGGLAGWMRRSLALEKAAAVESSPASSDAGDATEDANEGSTSIGGFILPLLALAAIVLVVLAAAALCPAVAGPLMGSTAPARWNAALQRYPAFQAASEWLGTALAPPAPPQLKARRALPPAPPARPAAHATALAVRKPPTPARAGTSFPLGALVAAVRGAPARLYALRSGGALVEVKTVKAALASVETPLRLLVAAGAGVALATAAVTGLLRLQGAEPLATMAAAAFPTSTPILGGRLRRLSGAAAPQELTFEETAAVEEEPEAEAAPRSRRRAAAPTRRTPRSTRRA